MFVINRTALVTTLLVGITFLALGICPLIGIVTITPSQLMHDESLAFIFWSIRVPRAIAALCAGGGLAVAGMMYQAIFRNPLADPYTLGVSSGASLGAALSILAGCGGSALGLSMISISALAGACGSLLIILCFAWSRESNSSTLLLAGVIVSTLCAGMIMFIHYVVGIQKSFQIIRWIMGGVDGINYTLLFYMAIPVILFCIISGVFMPQLDHFLTGDSIAHSRGVNVRFSRNMFVSFTAIAVGSIVAVCGPIGFVGIIAPHACRMVIPGARHRLLGFCSFLLGGTVLMITDTLARTLFPPSEIPVGIITAVLGGPFFLLLLFQRKSRLLM